MTTIPQAGDRIRLLAMQDDPDPIPSRQLGTVLHVESHVGKDAWLQIFGEFVRFQRSERIRVR